MVFWETGESPKERFRRHETILSALLGNRMKRLREEAGLSEQEAADILYISCRKFRHFESGLNHIPLIKIPPLAKAYGCEAHDFL